MQLRDPCSSIQKGKITKKSAAGGDHCHFFVRVETVGNLGDALLNKLRKVTDGVGISKYLASCYQTCREQDSRIYYNFNTRALSRQLNCSVQARYIYKKAYAYMKLPSAYPCLSPDLLVRNTSHKLSTPYVPQSQCSYSLPPSELFDRQHVVSVKTPTFTGNTVLFSFLFIVICSHKTR